MHPLARLRTWTIVAWAVMAVANLVAAVLPYRMYLLFTAERPLAELPLARLIFFERLAVRRRRRLVVEVLETIRGCHELEGDLGQLGLGLALAHGAGPAASRP